MEISPGKPDSLLISGPALLSGATDNEVLAYSEFIKV
jgi:hypothetical protein